MKARITWTSGLQQDYNVIREGTRTSTTDDDNETTWDKRSGYRWGTLSKDIDFRAIARLLPEEKGH